MTDIPHDASVTSEPASPHRRSGGKRGFLLVLGVVLLVPLFLWLRRPHAATSSAAGAHDGAGAAKGGGDPKDRVIPVVVAPATVRDVPVYLEGLGSVMPLQSVTLHSQVDGRLERVFFTEGQAVKRGELIAQIDPRSFTAQLHQVQATLARDTAQFRNAQVNLERYKSLRTQNLVPQQQVDDQQALADQQAAAMQQDQAQVENSKLQLDYARLVSPIDGVTGVRLVDPGNLVHASDAQGIVLITQLDPIAVVFTLPEDVLPEVAKQLAAGPLGVEAFARDGTTKLASGKLALIDNQIDAATATIKLKATFDNHEHALWPNQFVKARLLLTTLRGALTVPAAAIQRGPQGLFVYVASGAAGQSTVAMKPVEVARTEGDVAVLSSGANAGDSIVIDGQNQLKPGAKVVARAAEHAGAEHGQGGNGNVSRPRNSGSAP